MSDEFLKTARREIEDELAKIETIFDKCLTDKHIQENAANIQQHFHKIKGLAPMIGEDNIGKLAGISDTILKHTSKKETFPNSYTILVDVFQKMRTLFDQGNESLNINYFVKNIEKKISEVEGT